MSTESKTDEATTPIGEQRGWTNAFRLKDDDRSSSADSPAVFGSLLI
jgi:hypothetical protein